MRNALIATVAVIAATGQAHAVPTIFFGEDLFNGGDGIGVSPTRVSSDAARASLFANLTGVGTENFDGLPAGTAAPFAVSFGSAGMATVNSGEVTTGITAGRAPISGAQYLAAGTADFSLAFSAPIAAFGFYGLDVGDFGAQLTLTLGIDGGGTTVLTVPHTLGEGNSTSGSILYFGFFDTDTTYTLVAFGNLVPNTADSFGFDDFSIGSLEQVTPVIPEPVTWATMLLGFGLVGAAARRRRRVTLA